MFTIKNKVTGKYASFKGEWLVWVNEPATLTDAQVKDVTRWTNPKRLLIQSN